MSYPKPTDNPFTLVHNALWDLAEANKDLTKWIAKKNRQRYSTWIGPKQSVSSSDLPELVLISNTGTSNLHASSSGSSHYRTYQWIISTGDFRINDIYNQISWELYRAMIGWDTVLCGLTYKGEHFVKNANLTTLQEGDISYGEHGEIKGWTGIWGAEVLMYFSTALLRV